MKDLCICLKIEMQRSFPSLTMTARGHLSGACLA